MRLFRLTRIRNTDSVINVHSLRRNEELASATNEVRSNATCRSRAFYKLRNPSLSLSLPLRTTMIQNMNVYQRLAVPKDAHIINELLINADLMKYSSVHPRSTLS